MIIRSQDKKSITNFQQLTDVGIIKTDSVFAVQAYYPFSIDSEFSKMNLGFYSTEEKAIKVLDMIQESYLKTTECIIAKELAARVLPRAIVFQMPQDSEV